MSQMPPTADFVISTTSQHMDYSSSGQAPTITVNGAPFAQLAQPEFPSGFQLVILNAFGDLTRPDNIVYNDYFRVQDAGGDWSDTYSYMYDQIIGAVLTSGNIEQQLIILASFGLDADMTPANDMLALFLPRGAGPGLQQWALVPDPGSQGGSSWVTQPASYILVGNMSYGYGDGYETFVLSPGTEPAPASLEVTLTNNVPPTPPAEAAPAAATAGD